MTSGEAGGAGSRVPAASPACSGHGSAISFSFIDAGGMEAQFFLVLLWDGGFFVGVRHEQRSYCRSSSLLSDNPFLGPWATGNGLSLDLCWMYLLMVPGGRLLQSPIWDIGKAAKRPRDTPPCCSLSPGAPRQCAHFCVPSVFPFLFAVLWFFSCKR